MQPSMVPTTLGAKLALQEAATVKHLVTSVPQSMYLIIMGVVIFFLALIAVTVYLYLWRSRSQLEKVAPDGDDFDRKTHGFLLQRGSDKVAPDDLQKEQLKAVWSPLGGQKVSPLQFHNVETVSEQPLRSQLGYLFNKPTSFFTSKVVHSSEATNPLPFADSPTTKELNRLEQDDDRCSDADDHSSMALDFLDLDDEYPHHDDHEKIDIHVHSSHSPVDRELELTVFEGVEDLPPFYIADPVDGYNDYLKHIAERDVDLSDSEEGEDSSSEDEESQGSYLDGEKAT